MEPRRLVRERPRTVHWRDVRRALAAARRMAKVADELRLEMRRWVGGRCRWKGCGCEDEVERDSVAL